MIALVIARARRDQARALRTQADALDREADALEADAPVEAAKFSSVALPPRTSRRAFAEKCRAGQVRGARRIGRGRGAVWECASAAWFASFKTAVPGLRLVEPAQSDEELVELAMASARGRR